MKLNLDVFLFSFLISIAFMVWIVYQIRARKLKEQYAILWLLLSFAMMILSLFPKLFDQVAHSIGVDYAPSLLYLLGLIGVLLLLLHLSIAVSALTNKVIVLTQTVAIQEQQLAKLRAATDAGTPGGAPASEGGPL